MVAGSNPAVPTFSRARDGISQATDTRKAGRFVDTIYLLLGVVGFLLIIAAFFFGGFVILDFLFSRSEGDQ